MSKIVLFSRVSTMGQDLTQQTDELRTEASHLGYSTRQQIVIEFKESGISLDTDERLGIAELYRIIETDKDIDCVLIYEISRLSRRPKTLYEVRDWLVQHHVNLCCIKPSFKLLEKDGTMSQTAMILFSLFSSISESEMMIKKERMLRGRIAKREKCKFIGGNILFGYRLDEDDNIIIDNNNAEVVRKIFELYNDGLSIRQIAKDLIDSGKLPYEDYSTAEVMLRRMIRRSEYAGIKQKSYDYPAIIDIDTWNKTRERAEKRNKYKTRTKGIYFCQGKIIDKNTGFALSPNYLMNTYRVWIENLNRGYQINMNMIDSLVWYTVKKHFSTIKDTRKERIQSELKQRLLDIHDKIIIGRENIKKVNQKMDKINERIVNGKMSEKLGDRMIDEAKEEKTALRKQMISWDIEESQVNMQLRNIDTFSEIDFNAMNEQEIANFIREHVEQIIIDPIYNESGKMTSDRKIWVKMKDGVKYRYDSHKRGKFFDIFYQDKHGNIRKELNDFVIMTRFKRK